LFWGKYKYPEKAKKYNQETLRMKVLEVFFYVKSVENNGWTVWM